VRRDRREQSDWAEAIEVGSVGLEIAMAVGLGYLGGDWLDRRLNAAPAFALTGLGLGVLIGARAVWRIARRYLRGSGDDDRGS